MVPKRTLDISCHKVVSSFKGGAMSERTRASLNPLLLYLTVFVTGASVLIVEIIGTRVISPFFGNTVFAWSSLIAVTLGFLAVGYWLGGILSDWKPSLLFFYTIIFGAGISVFLIMRLDQPVLLFSDQFGLRFGPLVASLILFAPSLFLLGLVSPFAVKLRIHTIERVGKGAGNIYAFSTIGSVIGALLAGFMLTPVMSVTDIFNTVAVTLCILSLLGLTVVFLIAKGERAAAVAAVVVLLAAAGGASQVPIVSASEAEREIEWVEHTQSFYSDIKVVDVDGSRCLIVSGFAESCMSLETGESEWDYVYEMARIAHLLQRESGKERFRILVIGIGAGNIIGLLPEEAEIDALEIDEKVVQFARDHFLLEERENTTIHVNDARHFLRKTGHTYDLILASAYTDHLFTKELFEVMERHLEPGGVVLQLLEMQSSPNSRFGTSAAKTASKVFERSLFTVPYELSGGEDLVDAILHLTNREEYRPRLRQGYYFPTALELESGLVLRDDFNPFSFIRQKERMLARDFVVSITGYQGLFAS